MKGRRAEKKKPVEINVYSEYDTADEEVCLETEDNTCGKILEGSGDRSNAQVEVCGESSTRGDCQAGAADRTTGQLTEAPICVLESRSRPQQVADRHASVGGWGSFGESWQSARCGAPGVDHPSMGGTWSSSGEPRPHAVPKAPGVDHPVGTEGRLPRGAQLPREAGNGSIPPNSGVVGAQGETAGRALGGSRNCGRESRLTATVAVRRRGNRSCSGSSDDDVACPQYQGRVKLPPFTGKEVWEVWYNRFQDVAARRQWTEDQKIDVIIPLLQGAAGEYVYGQLSP